MEGNGHNRILQIDEEFKKNPPKVVTPEVKWMRVYLPNDNSHIVAKASDISTQALGVPFLVQGQTAYTPMICTIIKKCWTLQNGEWVLVEGQLEVMNGCVILQSVQAPDWEK